MRATKAVRNALATCVAALSLVAPAPAAAQQSEEYLAFLAELETPGQQWVIISYHFRHGDGCTAYGCVIIGPTTDQDACREWARLYNQSDPDDHSRCVPADAYSIPRY